MAIAKMGTKRPTSSEQALMELATHVAELLDEGGLEPQFASKIARRIRKEADRAGLLDAAAPDGTALSGVLEGLDSAVTQSRVAGLIEAMSDLRRTDAGAAP